jgi:hypothetical protein
MNKQSRFTVRKRIPRNRSPKFGLSNIMLQGRRRVLNHHHRSESPRRATLRRYNINRPLDDVDIPNTPRQRGRFREMNIEYNPRSITSNHPLQRVKFGLTDVMLQGRRRVLNHHHRSESPRKATLRRYNINRPLDDVDIPNTPRQRGRFREIDIEPIERKSSSSRRKRMSRKSRK